MRKEELKKLLSSFKEEDYYKSVDLHIHSNESDGDLNPIEILNQAHKKDLKYISIADHNTIDAYISTNIMADDIVIPAVEFDCIFKGIPIHILGYGFDIDNREMKTLYAKNRFGVTTNWYRIFHLRNPKEVIEKINNAGGLSVLAHPCCYWTLNLDKFIGDLVKMGLDGVEVYYPYKGMRSIVKFHSRKNIAQIADKYNLIKTGGTDCHTKNLL